MGPNKSARLIMGRCWGICLSPGGVRTKSGQIGLDRSNESCGLADSTSDVSGPGNKHCFSRSRIPKATDDCRRRQIGLCADAQIEDKKWRRIMKALIAALALA